jgi:ABC-type lipoprotein export system ATPase subunit
MGTAALTAPRNEGSASAIYSIGWDREPQLEVKKIQNKRLRVTRMLAVVIMGVCGSGKSTLGSALADSIQGGTFLEGAS